VTTSIRDRVGRHLEALFRCGPRPPGSSGNAAASAYVREVLAGDGLPVREDHFRTHWWRPGGGHLAIDGTIFPVAPNPYSPSCDVSGVVTRCSSVDALAGIEAVEVLILDGDLVAEQVTPIGYPFYVVDDHVRLLEQLRRLSPQAVIAVSDHWAPVFEDPALGCPSTTIPTRHGDALPAGAWVHLVLGGEVFEADAVNLSARTSLNPARVVVSAHLDSKVTTSGAFDNAGSLAAVLAAVEVGGLADLDVEIVPFNGEDHYDAGGELVWLEGTDLSEIVANVNLDGVGVAGRRIAASSLGAPQEVDATLTRFVADREDWVVGEPWMESDHAVFAMRGVPAVAVTSERVHDLLATIAHTEADSLDVVDLDRLARVASDLPELVSEVSHTLIVAR
jgi:aminopeptidase YwaD